MTQAKPMFWTRMVLFFGLLILIGSGTLLAFAAFDGTGATSAGPPMETVPETNTPTSVPTAAPTPPATSTPTATETAGTANDMMFTDTTVGTADDMITPTPTPNETVTPGTANDMITPTPTEAGGS